MIAEFQEPERARTKLVQVSFTDHHKPIAGHYLNKHTSAKAKKRKAEEEAIVCANACAKDSRTLTYNILYIPRILKSDLRRQYPVMFMNVFNSCNRDVIHGFAERFIRNDAQFILEAPTHDRPLKSFFRGRESCKNILFDRITDAPDIRFEISSVRIRVRSDGSCACFATYKYSGTALMYVDPNRLSTILRFCKENDSGILSLPYLGRSSPPSTNSTDSMNSSTSIHQFNILDGFEKEFMEIAQEAANKLKDIIPLLASSSSSTTASHYKMFQFVINKLLLRRFAVLCNLPQDECDYLFDVIENYIILNNTTREEETIPLAFPFQFGGDFTFHLDEESRILANEMRTYLLPPDN